MIPLNNLKAFLSEPIASAITQLSRGLRIVGPPFRRSLCKAPRAFVVIALLLFCTSSYAAIDPATLRNQIFGDYGKKILVDTFQFGTRHLAVINNSYVLTIDEYNYSWNAAKRDSTRDKRLKHVEDMIEMYQKAFTAMDMNLDTSTKFQLEFLQYKQGQLTPYLNKGMTRLEVEALPEFRYKIRHHYCGMIIFELMNNEVWTKANRDTQGQKDYYYSHLDKYQGQSFEISKTKVIHDWQMELQAKLIERAKANYAYKINTLLSDKL